MKKRRFILNVFTISASMLLVRIASTVTNIYISRVAGASAMGTYHMIFSVFTFGITFASSGLGFAVTRLVAENKYDEKTIVKKAVCISALMSLSAVVMFLCGSTFINKTFIRAKDGERAINLLAVGLPCMGISSVLRGYFIAKRKAFTVTVSALWEEGICIFATIITLKKLTGTELVYMSPIYGCLVSNIAAIGLDSICAVRCFSKRPVSKTKTGFKPLLRICTPIALGSYLRTALVSSENLLIPMQFAKYGTQNPVAEYGIIKGMAMVVVMFPTVFIQGFSSMLVPEMSELNSINRKNGIRHVFGMAISAVMFFSVFIALLLYCHHHIISRALFKEQGVSGYLALLSLLAIPMYLDTVTDSVLKGLDLQNACLKYNIIDSILRVSSLIIFLPRYGPVFYIAMLYISEIFNLTLSLGKAFKATGLKADWYCWVILPFLSAFSAFWFKNPIIQTLIYVGMYYVGIKLYSKYDSI